MTGKWSDFQLLVRYQFSLNSSVGENLQAIFVTLSAKRVARTSAVLDMHNGDSHEIVVSTTRNYKQENR
jgi:predicted deacylase